MDDGKWEEARAHWMEREVELLWAGCLCMKGAWEGK